MARLAVLLMTFPGAGGDRFADTPAMCPAIAEPSAHLTVLCSLHVEVRTSGLADAIESMSKSS
jgi:hypothetical protein